MYEQCNSVGPEKCLPLYYEQVYFVFIIYDFDVVFGVGAAS